MRDGRGEEKKRDSRMAELEMSFLWIHRPLICLGAEARPLPTRCLVSKSKNARLVRLAGKSKKKKKEKLAFI